MPPKNLIRKQKTKIPSSKQKEKVKIILPKSKEESKIKLDPLSKLPSSIFKFMLSFLDVKDNIIFSNTNKLFNAIIRKVPLDLTNNPFDIIDLCTFFLYNKDIIIEGLNIRENSDLNHLDKLFPNSLFTTLKKLTFDYDSKNCDYIPFEYTLSGVDEFVS